LILFTNLILLFSLILFTSLILLFNLFVYVHIILKKTHFNFREIEKPSGLLCFLYTRFLHCFLAVRASRHSRNGRFALQ